MRRRAILGGKFANAARIIIKGERKRKLGAKNAAVWSGNENILFAEAAGKLEPKKAGGIKQQVKARNKKINKNIGSNRLRIYNFLLLKVMFFVMHDCIKIFIIFVKLALLNCCKNIEMEI